MKEKIPIEVLSHYGGNVSDNVNDDLFGGKLTFQRVITEVNELNHNLPLTDTVFGVIRQMIEFGDPFHLATLAITHVSKTAFEERERDIH